ncbi:adenylyl-sulfate kinase [Flavobacterium sp. 5]|uniref:adenylyl-sulfate kinase n=1 Tax=Flavobacterium sp. 5 TaxID=2035199 RepID=UPI000C2CD06F|nr:adenylyl-sulfate kinase [Flavobacterium sp. 5]PKB17445.1 adenylylsulfate kinase [Flavobacterium sp. 5]
MEKSNLVQSYTIGRKDREAKNGHRSFLIWFTGLSGSGKSTIANLLETKLYQQDFHTYTLDGDNLRNGLNKELAFTEEGRNENLRRTAEVAKLFVDAGTIVIGAFISPTVVVRELVKNIVGCENYVEVFVNTPLAICEQRDIKGLYKKARTGEIKNFTGISSPYENPVKPDIIIHTIEESPEQAVEKIMGIIKKRLY